MFENEIEVRKKIGLILLVEWNYWQPFTNNKISKFFCQRWKKITINYVKEEM
jgi:hypothetical protein